MNREFLSNLSGRDTIAIWRTGLFESFIHNIDQCTNIDLIKYGKEVQMCLLDTLKPTGLFVLLFTGLDELYLSW